MIQADGRIVPVPPGGTHRIENPGKISLIEVQSGTCLDDHDIVPVQEVYRRA